uniref:Uncharacterized protein LOC111124864 isoform X1 n=1 Tax=Crassostrea virginica TaxID=6565 RepID=A0A8B8D8E4_CRAVI|nr:uncharacterized protein LOC111124864 isoform X1 [Crassostrea virginica]
MFYFTRWWTFFLLIPLVSLMEVLKVDFKICDEKCIKGKSVKSFVLHLKCKINAWSSPNKDEDSCIVRPNDMKTLDYSNIVASNISTDTICQSTPKTRLPTTFCVEKTKTCRDITHVIDSTAILHGNHTDIVSLTLIQHNPRSVQNASENMFDIFNIFLNVDLKDIECRTQMSCSWSVHNVQWSDRPKHLSNILEQDLIFSGSESTMDSPAIFGSDGHTCLKWKMRGSGNVSLLATSTDSQIMFAKTFYEVQHIYAQKYGWNFGKIDVPFILRFRFHAVSTHYVKVMDVTFAICNADSYRNCSFESSLPCPLVESYHGCKLVRTKGDPHKDIDEWMLLTRKDHCKNEFTSSFTTVTLAPVLGNKVCEIHLTTYGNLRWYWRICFLNNVCNNRTIPRTTSSRQTYKFPITNISQRYKLEFSTVHLDSKTFLGLLNLAFSENCFQNSSTKAVKTVDLTQNGTQREPRIFMVAAVLILCFLVLFVILLGIVRKRRRLCLHYKSSESFNNTVSIHDFLASKSVEKTLEDILTEGNPNYRWYSHRLLKGTIVEIDKSQIQINTLLGRGAFGEVFRGILLGRERKGNNTDIAVKRLSKSADQQSQDKFLLEALILFKFQHKNIVKCLGISSSNGGYMILLELMLGGDLKTFLRNTKDKQTQKSTLKVSELLGLASDVACGLNYLESLHFVHRDVAARNCLLTNLGPNRVVKLGDFGLAKDILLHDYYRKEGTALLPIRWMPPEAFLEGYFSSKSDVWAFGVLMWEIFTSGFIPYPGLQNNDVMTFVKKGDV